ncbi:MAG: chromosome partitioning protein ParA, partial [Sphingobacteriaceae bacterium]
MIFTIGGIKGGTGKTTISTNLSIWLSRKGFDVLLVDADEQESASDFTAWREETKQGNIGYTL